MFFQSATKHENEKRAGKPAPTVRTEQCSVPTFNSLICVIREILGSIFVMNNLWIPAFAGMTK